MLTHDFGCVEGEKVVVTGGGGRKTEVDGWGYCEGGAGGGELKAAGACGAARWCWW